MNVNSSTSRSRPQYPPPRRQPISKLALKISTKIKVDLLPQYLTIESIENKGTEAETGRKELPERQLKKNASIKKKNAELKKNKKNASILDRF